MPKESKITKTKWIFDLKTDGKDSMIGIKRGLVAKNFLKIEGAEYVKVTCPVAKSSIVRLLAALSVHFD